MKEIQNKIDKYYSEKLDHFGLTPKGVDWKDNFSQELRFQQLLKVVDFNENFSINDLGCGFGSLLEFMTLNIHSDFCYTGYDFSEKMISAAKEKFGGSKNSKFLKIDTDYCLNRNDYTIASGIFNVLMDCNEKEWLDYILKTINVMNDYSQKGFSFNILSNYSDKKCQRKDLFYGEPTFFFDYCMSNFSRNVSILHDYGLFEFTILIKK